MPPQDKKKLKKQTELKFFNIFKIFSYADGYSPPLQVAQRYVIQVLEKKKGKTSWELAGELHPPGEELSQSTHSTKE